MSRTRATLTGALAALLVALAAPSGAATAGAPSSSAPRAAAPSATPAPVPTDGGLLAFVRKNQIYTATQSGTSVRRLTSAGKNFRPHWSPDGRRIAYVHELPGNVRDIWVMNADGSNEQQVTHLGDTSEPAWSPHGAYLAFGADGTPPYASYGGTALQEIRSRAPFGSPVPFQGDGDPNFDPRVQGTLDWAPDGTRIAFASDYYPDSPDHYLLVYTLATHEVDELLAVGGSCCGEGFLADPAWTRDSGSVTLSALVYADGDPQPAGPSIWTVHDPDRARTTFPEVGDRDVDYSATGHRMVFSHYSRIFVADSDGTHRRQVLVGYHPDWQPTFG